MKTVLLFALTQLKRILRDPVTLLVLFAIPVLLLVLFGAFMRGADNLSLPVAIVNQSSTEYASEFEAQLRGIDVFRATDEGLSLEAAQEQLKNSEVDGVIELSPGFGGSATDIPAGSVRVYTSGNNMNGSDVLSSIVNGVVDQANSEATGYVPPITVEEMSVEGNVGGTFSYLFAIFTAMGIMMVGIFGVASVVSSDKKTGILRRLCVTPLRAWQIMTGTMLAFGVICLGVVALMTALGMLLFGLEMNGNWFVYVAFIILASLLMLSLGLVVGGIAKNTTQADIYGQIVFIVSLGFSGIWLPRMLMPDWLQAVTSFLPLTPVIDGIRHIVTEGAMFTDLWMELLVIVGWLVVVFIVGTRTFRWE